MPGFGGLEPECLWNSCLESGDPVLGLESLKFLGLAGLDSWNSCLGVLESGDCVLGLSGLELQVLGLAGLDSLP